MQQDNKQCMAYVESLLGALSTHSGSTDLLTRHDCSLHYPIHVCLHIYQQACHDVEAVSSHEHALLQHHKPTARACPKTYEMAGFMLTQHSKGHEVAWKTPETAECKRADQSDRPAAWLLPCGPSGQSWPSAGFP